MSWSYRIATVRGIALKVHVTFALIVLIVAANWSPLGPAGVAFGVGLALLLFACVTLHEFGHALVAQHYAIPVREVILLPIGGVAVLGRNPRNAWQELAIAGAGPAVNVAIVALLLPVLWVLGEPLRWDGALLRPAPDATLSLAEAVGWLAAANVSLVLFNLIPAFPLDGGRILRGLLGLGMEWSRATSWATAIGQGLAGGIAVYALLGGQPMLLIIAVLVFVTAAATEADERARALLVTQRAGDACNRHAITLVELDRLSTIVRYLLTSYQPDFAVLHGRELRGVVLREDVLAALAARREDSPVAALMRPCPRVEADASLADVRAILDASSVRVAAVFDAGSFVGLVGPDDIREVEMVLMFMRGPAGHPALPRPSAAAPAAT